MQKKISLLLATGLLLALCACGENTPAPTIAPTDPIVTEATQTPTANPTEALTESVTTIPTEVPTHPPTEASTAAPTQFPTERPTAAPTQAPTAEPTVAPTKTPTVKPTTAPTVVPTQVPTQKPIAAPTQAPTLKPTATPTQAPAVKPTIAPTAAPTQTPTQKPTAAPTQAPTPAPTQKPTAAPTQKPTTCQHIYITTDLSSAATEAAEAGYMNYARYASSSYCDYNTRICTACHYIDLASTHFKYTQREAAQIMLDYVNNLRAEVFGTHAYDLSLDDFCQRSAEIRAGQLKTNYSHSGQLTPGECITSHLSLYEQFDSLKNSPSHYEIMIRKDNQYFGYGYSSNISEDWVATQGFGCMTFG